MDYATLIADKTTKGSIAHAVNYSSGKLAAEWIVEEAESWIYSRLRVREMLAVANGTIAIGASTIDLTSLDVLAPIIIRRYGSQDNGRIFILDPDHFEERTYFDDNNDPVDGTPTTAMHIGDTLYLNAKPETAVKWRMAYFRKPPMLSISGTNFLTKRYSSILMPVLRSYAYREMKDDARADSWLKIGLDAINEANGEADIAAAAQQREFFWGDN